MNATRISDDHDSLALASRSLTIGEGVVFFLFREEPKFVGDSGWVIFSTDDVVDDDLEPIELSTLLLHYPNLLNVFECLAPCEFEWIEATQEFRSVPLASGVRRPRLNS